MHTEILEIFHIDGMLVRFHYLRLKKQKFLTFIQEFECCLSMMFQDIFISGISQSEDDVCIHYLLI